MSEPGAPRFPSSCFALKALRRSALAACLFATLAASAQPATHSSSPHQNRADSFTVVIDAAHGGSNLGAKLSPTLDEKSVTLTLAKQLRSQLAAHGISAVMTRTTDTDPSLDTRAGIANHAHAAACLILHATGSGIGVHIFTSSLAPAPAGIAPAWNTAQAAYVDQSIRLSSEIDAAFEHTPIPAIIGRTFLQPLDNLTCPAIAIELAPEPPTGLTGPKPVSDPRYQSAVLNAIVAGILQWRQDETHRP